MTATTTSIEFEPFDPAWRRDAFRQYAALREAPPVFRSPHGYWVITRHRDLVDALKNPDHVFSSAPNGSEMVGRFAADVPEGTAPAVVAELRELVAGMPVDLEEVYRSRPIVAADPPDHSRLRKCVVRAFTPKRVAQLEPQIEEVVAECLAGVERADSYDVMAQLGVPIPVRIIGEALGVAREHHPRLRYWQQQLMAAASGGTRGTAEAKLQQMRAFREFADFFVPLIEEHRTSTSYDDVITDIVRAEDNDVVTPVETLNLVQIVMRAGNDSTANLIGNTVLALMEHPDQLALLIESPQLVPAAIEESLRYWGPFHFVMRTATAPVTVAGTTIPPGEPIALMVGAANHDPEVYDDADTFDITRNPQHLAFGHGAHMCIGTHLARAEARVAITRILPHLPNFELSPEPLDLCESALSGGFKKIVLRRRSPAQ
jgi:cytochrome P450